MNSFRATVAHVALAITLFTMVACSDQGATSQQEAKENAGSPVDTKPVIVASIEPLASVARSMLGDHAEVVTLLPGGRSPHGFNPTASQMRYVSQADVILTVGLGIDPWATRAADADEQGGNKQITMADLLGIRGQSSCALCAAGIEHDHKKTNGHPHDHQHEHEHEHKNAPIVNGHLWMDPVLMKQYVQLLQPIMEGSFATHRQMIAANTTTLLAELDALNETYQTKLEDVPVKQLVTFHNAFDLLADRYGLKVVAHLAEIDSHGPSVTARELREVEQAIGQYDLKVIYREPQMAESAALAVQQQTGVALLVLDPLGKAGESYATLMQRNLTTLLSGQSK